MSELVQVYIRLKPYNVTRGEIVRLGHVTEDIVRRAALENYNGPVDIDVLLESGTLKTTLTVIGSILLGGYYFVGNYKAFKEGVVEIVEDGKKFGNAVSEAFLTASKASRFQVDQKAIRQKTPGKLKRVLADVERLDEAAAQTGGRYSEVGLQRVSRRLKSVLREMDDDEAAGITGALKFENLPPIEKWPEPIAPAPEPDHIGVKPNEEDLQLDIGEEEREALPKRRKLRYHNRIHVER